MSLAQLLVTALASVLSGNITETTYPHGGIRPKPPPPRYKGPTDTNRRWDPFSPRRPGSPSGPATPAGPRSPGPPSSTGSAIGGPAPRPTPATFGLDLSTPEDSWTFWWDYNRERFLNLRRRLGEIRPLTGSDEFFLGLLNRGENHLSPSREVIRRQVHPVLRRLLENSRDHQPNEISSALIALARLRIEGSESTGLIARHLGSKSQEVRESAALSLGILAAPPALPLLFHLARDSAAGRKLVYRHEVSLRTRAFAAFALGVAGSTMAGPENRLRRSLISRILLELLEEKKTASPELRVALISALGLIEPPPKMLRKVILPRLEAMLEDRRGTRDVVRAHIPTAIARLGAVDHIDPFLQRLSRPREDALVRQSIVLALGSLAPRADDGKKAEMVESLQRILGDARSLQERRFALIALAQIATPEALKILLNKARRGRGAERPWAALALGVVGNDLRPEESLDAEIPRVLLRALSSSRAPSRRSAHAIALGLLGEKKRATPLLVSALKASRIESLTGHLAVGLALMRAEGVRDLLLDLAAGSRNRPEQLRNLSTALGLLGDQEIVPALLEMLSRARTTTVRAAISQALGRIGDARCLRPLIAMVTDPAQTALARSAAISALGLMGEPGDLPWRERLERNVNYRASTETLNGRGGVLDIL